jgi:hypothetical protein
MADYDSLDARHHEIQDMLKQHADLIDDTQSKLPEDCGLDRMTVFRFLKRDEFDQEAALAKLHKTLQWREEQGINELCLSDLHEALQQEPILFFHQDMRDRWERPVATMHFSRVKRVDETGLEPLKSMITHTWETARKYIEHLNKTEKQQIAQISLIVDVKDAGMANLVGLLLFLSKIPHSFWCRSQR